MNNRVRLFIVKGLTHVLAGTGLLLNSGFASAVELNDLDITIKVIESDSSSEIEVANELKLPEILKDEFSVSSEGTSVSSEIEKDRESEAKEEMSDDGKETRETSDEPHEDLHERESDDVRDIRDYHREREDSTETEREYSDDKVDD